MTTQGLANNNGNNLRLLYDKDGRLRYIGESSPFIVLRSKKNLPIYTWVSEFTDDPDTVNIIDGISHVKQSRVLQMPKENMPCCC